MARKSLRPHLNQIRTWVRQGRTDAWVAHQLEVTVRDIEQFKRQNELVGNGETTEGAGPSPTDYPDEVDLRAEDDALIAAELEAAEAKAERERAEAEAERAAAGDTEEVDEQEAPSRTRRRSRRGGRRRSSRAGAGPLEGTFDHGEDGYGLWLDPAIQDDPVYAEHWAGHRSISVTVEEDQIVIKRVGDDV
ncbi:MAG TPA: hypothetical protein VMG80_02090 [Solirubrobacteraceae bacterium]|nr:hypothetical protein [Solirubrobacteraceae bacterium]